MSLLRHLYWRLFGCAHLQRLKKLDSKGVLWLECWDCGHSVEAISRTPAERKAIKQKFGPKRQPATVLKMRRKA